jgi:hypothetical protein
LNYFAANYLNEIKIYKLTASASDHISYKQFNGLLDKLNSFD